MPPTARILSALAGTLAVAAVAFAVEQRGNGVPLPAGPAAAPAKSAPATPPTPPGGYPARLVLPQEERALVLDATSKDYAAQPGEQSCTFTFRATNTSSADIVVTQIRTSCGCSVAKLPAQPWRLAPGATGEFQIVVDLRGKRGLLAKTAIIDTERGYKQIDFRITIPEPDPRDEMRLRNLLIAQSDRQAVLRGECAQCHVEPARGKLGRELYAAACAICHADEHRASMVPDLRALSPAPAPEVWRALITHGKPGTLMPAFAQAHEGFLTDAQIDSLVEYLTGAFTAEMKPAPTAKH